MKPLITVIVPVYNGQDYLLNCINSIQDQTYENIEIIVVDDGSKDGTPAVCRELEKRYADSGSDPSGRQRSFRCITLGDEGVSAARNRAMDIAQGEYIAFVDADDRILPDMIQVLYDTICKTGSDAAGCRFSVWGSEAEWKALCERSGWPEEGAKRDEATVYTPEEYCKQEILKGNSRCWSKLYKRGTVGGLRFEEGLTIGEDMLFLLRLQGRLERIAEVSYAGYGYYQNPDGAMNRKFTKSAMDQIYCWEKAREVLGASPLVDRHIVVSIMLTAGRLAGLNREERLSYAKEAAQCRQKLREYLNRNVFRLLDTGYKVKVLLFLLLPGVYLHLYHSWKKDKRE